MFLNIGQNKTQDGDTHVILSKELWDMVNANSKMLGITPEEYVKKAFKIADMACKMQSEDSEFVLRICKKDAVSLDEYSIMSFT